MRTSMHHPRTTSRATSRRRRGRSEPASARLRWRQQPAFGRRGATDGNGLQAVAARWHQGDDGRQATLATAFQRQHGLFALHRRWRSRQAGATWLGGRSPGRSWSKAQQTVGPDNSLAARGLASRFPSSLEKRRQGCAADLPPDFVRRDRGLVPRRATKTRPFTSCRNRPRGSGPQICPAEPGLDKPSWRCHPTQGNACRLVPDNLSAASALILSRYGWCAGHFG